MLDTLAIKIVFFFYKTTEDLMPHSFGEEDILEKICKIHLVGSSCNVCSWILRTHGANNLMASIRPWRVLKSELNYVLVLRSMGFCSGCAVSNRNVQYKSTSLGSIFSVSHGINKKKILLLFNEVVKTHNILLTSLS